MVNPLLENWETPFGTPPFNLIEINHYRPATVEAIRIAAEEIAQITGLTRSNVKIKLFRVRKKLQHSLENILKENALNRFRET